MNPIFKWLTFGSGNKKLEQKAGGNNLIAFHAGSIPAWSSYDNAAIAKNGFCRNPVVHRCISMIAQAATSIPFNVCEDGIDCDVHPLLTLLKKPNPRQSGSKVLEALYCHLLISGNAYLMRVHLADELRELHLLEPEAVSVAQELDGWPTTYRYASGDQQKLLSADGDRSEVLHLALFNPVDEVAGLSPLSAAYMALDIHNSASGWNKALLDNSARPSGALVYVSPTGDNLSEEQFDRLKSELEQGYSGSMNAGRPMVLEGGLDWKAMGYSPRDMDFLQAKNGAAREIALAFGVPPMLLGIPGDNTYSNYQEANRAFWVQTVIPLARRIAQDIGNWLATDFAGSPELDVAADRVSALSSDYEAQWKRISEAGFLTENEKREVLGFPPVEDGDNVTS